MLNLVSISLGKADIVIYLFLLLFIIIGFAKGFMKMLVGLLKTFAAFGTAYFLCNPFAAFLGKTKINNMIYDKLLSIFSEKSEIFNAVIDVENFSGQLDSAAAELNIPEFLNKFIFSGIDASNFSADSTLGSVVASSLTNAALVVIAFIIIFIVATILVLLIGKLFISMVENFGFRFFDRLLGLIVSGSLGVILILGLFIVVNLIGILVPNVSLWLQNQIYYDGYNPDAFSIARVLYENNPLNSLFVTPTA